MNVWLLFSLMCAGIAAVGFWAAFSKSPGDDMHPSERKKHYYFAQFHPQAENPEGYSVVFPDIPGCNTCGDNLFEAMSMASDALTGYLEVARDRGEEIPAPSDFNTAKMKGEAYYAELGIPPSAATLYLLVPADPHIEPSMSVNISLQTDLLSQIDRQAKEAGLTRSDLMAVAAREYMQRREVA